MENKTKDKIWRYTGLPVLLVFVLLFVSYCSCSCMGVLDTKCEPKYRVIIEVPKDDKSLLKYEAEKLIKKLESNGVDKTNGWESEYDVEKEMGFGEFVVNIYEFIKDLTVNSI